MGVREGLKLMRHRTPQALSLVHPGLLTADIVFVKTGQINSQKWTERLVGGFSDHLLHGRDR